MTDSQCFSWMFCFLVVKYNSGSKIPDWHLMWSKRRRGHPCKHSVNSITMFWVDQVGCNPERLTWARDLEGETSAKGWRSRSVLVSSATGVLVSLTPNRGVVKVAAFLRCAPRPVAAQRPIVVRHEVPFQYAAFCFLVDLSRFLPCLLFVSLLLVQLGFDLVLFFIC